MIKKYKNQLVKILIVLAFIMCFVIMEAYRYKGEVIFLQPHEYTKEVNLYIKKMDMVYAPFVIILPVIALYAFRDIFAFLFSDYIDGKKYKIVLVLLIQFSIFILDLKCLTIVLNAGELLYKTGNIIVPAYKIALPYTYVIGTFIGARVVMKTIKKDYEKEVANNELYQDHLKWMENIKNINKEERDSRHMKKI
jgi:hypothetical protein